MTTIQHIMKDRATQLWLRRAGMLCLDAASYGGQPSFVNEHRATEVGR